MASFRARRDGVGYGFLPFERPRETLVVRERKATGLRATVKADMFSWSGFAEGAGKCAAQGMSSRGKGKVQGVDVAGCNAWKPPRGKQIRHAESKHGVLSFS